MHIHSIQFKEAGSGWVWASNMTIVLRAGRAWTYFLWAGPHNSICGPGRICTIAAGPGPQIIFAGWAWGLNFRPVQGPSGHLFQNTANCYWQSHRLDLFWLWPSCANDPIRKRGLSVSVIARGHLPVAFKHVFL